MIGVWTLKVDLGAVFITPWRSPLAYLCILTQYLRAPKNFGCDVGRDPASDPALAGEGERLLHVLRNEI